MRNEEKLEKILLKAKTTKKINLSTLEQFELNENEMEKIISFFVSNGIEEIKELDESKMDSQEDFSNINDSTTMYMNEINQYKLLTPEEEKQLFALYKNGDMKAREKIIESNLKLVVKCAKRYYYSTINCANIDFLDLIQGGNFGLMKAVEKFDLEKQYKFSTYAVWWIRQGISRLIHETKHTIKVSINMVELISRVKTFENQFLLKNGRAPILKEYFQNINASEENIRYAINASKEVLSLNVNINDDDDSTLETFLADEKNDYDDIDNKAVVDDILILAQKKLSKREIEILKLRYGLDNGYAHTLEEIAKIYGLSRERIRQAEMTILRKLKSITKSEVEIRQLRYEGKRG